MASGDKVTFIIISNPIHRSDLTANMVGDVGAFILHDDDEEEEEEEEEKEEECVHNGGVRR
jgi:hypothetical protein